MTLTIELSPEEEARLSVQASQQGQAITERAHDLVRAGLGISLDAEITDAKITDAKITDAKLVDLNRRLQAAGLLTDLPTHPGQTVPFQPIIVLGPPVSQTLLEDRE